MSEGDLSGGAWWSSGDSRLATPEGPAGAHSGPCVIESPWLLPLAGSTRTQEAGPRGFAIPPPLSTVVHKQEQGCRIRTRAGPGGSQDAGGRAGSLARVSGQLRKKEDDRPVYLSWHGRMGGMIG